MAKPIVYHSFEEKVLLEKELAKRVSKKAAKDASIALMNIFFQAGRRGANKLKSKRGRNAA